MQIIWSNKSGFTIVWENISLSCGRPVGNARSLSTDVQFSDEVKIEERGKACPTEETPGY